MYLIQADNINSLAWSSRRNIYDPYISKKRYALRQDALNKDFRTAADVLQKED